MENEELINGEEPLSNVLFIVLLNKNDSFEGRAPYNLEILGKKMWEWVALSGSGARIVTSPCTEESDVVSLIKPFVKNEEVVMVFYSDTPLISRSSVIEILDSFKHSGKNVLVLPRGYVFCGEYLKQCDSILADTDVKFTSPEFEKIDSFKKLTKVWEYYREMILGYHMDNGVYIVDPKSTFIDADVVIEKGVKIMPNNVIRGESYIGENVTLEANNTIINSIISNNVVVKNSYICNSRITENMVVGPFESVIDKGF